MKESLFYYIKYDEISEGSGGDYPHIVLEKVFNYSEVEEQIKHKTNKLFGRNIERKFRQIEPILITNDVRLSLKYRFIFDEIEFRKWCGLSIEVTEDKPYYLRETKHCGLDISLGKEVYSHFNNILNRKYDQASMIKGSETLIYDDGETSGWSEGKYDNGWSTSISNDEYEFKLNILSSKDAKWWHNLDITWKEIFKNKVRSQFYLNIPSEKTLLEILEIEELDLQLIGNEIRIQSLDLSILSHLKILKRLTLISNKVINLEKITEISSLETLEISGVSESELIILSKLVKLRRLELPYNNLIDIEVLSNLRNLEYLDISNNKIFSLSLLKNLPKIKHLNCGNNEISSLSSIESCVELTHLICYHNVIENLWPLINLDKLKYIACSQNKITNLVPLKNLDYFNIRGNKISKEEIQSFRNALNYKIEKFEY